MHSDVQKRFYLNILSLIYCLISSAQDRYLPSEDVAPMYERHIGGLPPSPPPPALPPKDYPYNLSNYDRLQIQPSQSAITTSQLIHMTAVERSEALRVARMEPHLQVSPLYLITYGHSRAYFTSLCVDLY